MYAYEVTDREIGFSTPGDPQECAIGDAIACADDGVFEWEVDHGVITLVDITEGHPLQHQTQTFFCTPELTAWLKDYDHNESVDNCKPIRVILENGIARAEALDGSDSIRFDNDEEAE